MYSSISRFFSWADDALEDLFLSRPKGSLLLLTCILIFVFSPLAPRGFEAACQEEGTSLERLDKYLLERPFFDKFPADEKAKYEIYYLTKKGVGVFAILEHYKEIDEFFFFKAVLGRMAYWFPHSKIKGFTRYKLENCEGPGSFNLKLTLEEDPKAGKKKRVYYSWKEFEKDSLPENLCESIAALVQGSKDLKVQEKYLPCI